MDDIFSMFGDIFGGRGGGGFGGFSGFGGGGSQQQRRYRGSDLRVKLPGRYLSAKQHATPVNKKHFRLARSGSSASVKRSPPCVMATPSPASS